MELITVWEYILSPEGQLDIHKYWEIKEVKCALKEKYLVQLSIK